MTGWNLPPGCSVRDIPGNRPEDEEAEALADAIYECLKLPDTRETDDIVERLMELCAKIYADGYSHGRSDEAMARDYKEGKL